MIHTPIFVCEPNDISIFTSIETATRSLEAIDVLNNEYIAYDSEGRLLSLSVRIVNKREVVSIESTEVNPTHQNELHNHLVTFLRAVEADQPRLMQQSLEALVEISLKYKID